MQQTPKATPNCELNVLRATHVVLRGVYSSTNIANGWLQTFPWRYVLVYGGMLLSLWSEKDKLC